MLNSEYVTSLDAPKGNPFSHSHNGVEMFDSCTVLPGIGDSHGAVLSESCVGASA
jgi:hypothetical protein